MLNQKKIAVVLGLLVSAQSVYAAEQCLKYPKILSYRVSEEVYDAQVSPTGDALYVVLQTKLQVIDLETGAVTKEIPLKDLGGVKLSATGLLAVNEADNTEIINILTGEKKVLDVGHTSYGYAFSSDGRYLLHDFGNDYLIYDISSGRMNEKISKIIKSSSWSFSFGGKSFGNSSVSSPQEKLLKYGIYYNKADLKSSPTILSSDGKLLSANADMVNGVVRLVDAGSAPNIELLRVSAPEIKEEANGPSLFLTKMNVSKDGEYIIDSVESWNKETKSTDRIVGLHPTPPPCPEPEAPKPASAVAQGPAPQEAAPEAAQPSEQNAPVTPATSTGAAE